LAGIVAIGLGGSFNFVSGRVRRAPLWVQKIGMEWIYRIIQEPRRLFMRYFTDAFYLAADILTEPFRSGKDDK
jgi:N-acetylglucosaminyldiphosphoundecaprenol N-acetyl-beta-D-mannosaminyltransferase